MSRQFHQQNCLLTTAVVSKKPPLACLVFERGTSDSLLCRHRIL